MQPKRRPRALWAAYLCALMPPIYIRCSTPDEVPAPPGARSSQLSAAERPAPVNELRALVVEHGDLSARRPNPALRSPLEDEYHDAIGRALGRLVEAARVTAGPCSSGPAATADVAPFERLVALLREEADHHQARYAAADDRREDEERRHGARALGLLDEVELAYADLENGARHRASAGCLSSSDV